MESICRLLHYTAQKFEFAVDIVENIVGKGEKHFQLSHKIFKRLFLQGHSNSDKVLTKV